MSYRNVIESAFEIKATGGGVIVSVRFELHASVSEDRRVISPRRFGQVHVTWPTVETSLQEKKELVR